MAFTGATGAVRWVKKNIGYYGCTSIRQYDPDGAEQGLDLTKRRLICEIPNQPFHCLICYLRWDLDGDFCTLPHLIELMQVKILSTIPHPTDTTRNRSAGQSFCKSLLAISSGALVGQIASAKVAMARLSSPHLYFVLSGNDFSLDSNNQKNKIYVLATSHKRYKDTAPCYPYMSIGW